MEEKIRYDINFFTPHTPFLKDNVRLIVISVLIWAMAVFGFHFLLKIVEKPTPEPAYLTYQKVWAKKDAVTKEEKQELAKVYLTLTGKYISLRTNAPVQAAFTGLVHDLLPNSEKDTFLKAVAADKTTAYMAGIAEALDLQDGLLKEAIPFTLGKFDPATQEANLELIPGIMDKHLIHNQSFLTDTKVFGFPLHYFYTAVLLKIIFCLICLVYCKAIDGIMKKHGLEAANE